MLYLRYLYSLILFCHKWIKQSISKVTVERVFLNIVPTYSGHMINLPMKFIVKDANAAKCEKNVTCGEFFNDWRGNTKLIINLFCFGPFRSDHPAYFWAVFYILPSCPAFLGGPIWRNPRINIFPQRNLEELYIFWRTSENRNVVGHRNFVFWRTEYGKVPILRTLILLKQ